MHGTTLAVGHAPLAAKKFCDNTRDGTAAEDGEGVTTIGGDHAVVLEYTMLESN